MSDLLASCQVGPCDATTRANVRAEAVCSGASGCRPTAAGAPLMPQLIHSPTVSDYIRVSKADNTLRGYRSDWLDFCGWCESRGLPQLPAAAETVAAYIADCAGRLKVGSLQRRLNAIAQAHKLAGFASPTQFPMVANTMKGIRRTKGTAPSQKAPAVTDDIRAMVEATDDGLIGLRDRALLLLGFAGAFRRSELVGLDVADCAFGKDGLTVRLRRSKTDQEGAGRSVGIPYGSNPATCPVRTLQSWLELAALTEGAVFRSINRHGQLQPRALSGMDVARIVKKLAERAGLDPAKYAGHSLRAGHATAAPSRRLFHIGRQSRNAIQRFGAGLRRRWLLPALIDLTRFHLRPTRCIFSCWSPRRCRNIS